MLYVTITACMFQEFEEAVYTTPDMTLDGDEPQVQGDTRILTMAGITTGIWG